MSSRVPFFLEVPAVVYPKDGNGLTVVTGAVDMEKYDAVTFLLFIGVANDSASITAISVQQSATTTSGDFASMGAPWTHSSLTGTDDNTTVRITVRKTDLTAGKRYTRLTCTVSAHSVMVGMAALGYLPIPSDPAWALPPQEYPKPNAV